MSKSFIDKFYDLMGEEYKITSKKIDFDKKIKIKHICGFEYEINPNNFLSIKKCQKCFGKNKTKKTHKQFKQEVFDLLGDEYKIFGKYIDDITDLKIIHNKCNKSFWIKPKDFLVRKNCPICSYIIRSEKSDENFLKKVYDLVGDEYTFFKKYMKSYIKTKVKHNKCGYEYTVLKGDFLYRDIRCPKCSESKGEKQISQYLDNNNVKYIPQYKFKDCRNIRPLPFDFAIFDNNNDLICLVEYDGEFHFKNTKANDFILKHSLISNTMQHDKIKNKYCIDNNIKLIRIPYFQKERIEQILNMKLERYGVINK